MKGEDARGAEANGMCDAVRQGIESKGWGWGAPTD